MFQVSKDSPAYYLTSVTKHRLPVFRTNAIAEITCKAIDEARRSGKFLIFAYVVMLEHLHLVTDNSRSSKDIHRFVNGIISRRVIDHLKVNGHEESLKNCVSPSKPTATNIRCGSIIPTRDYCGVRRCYCSV
ncbi:hypothetical protein BH10ACI3_BH10ACI3_22240 [soil metagenome]